jgi:drug/metabolite transporter (DMT)-like permease
LRFAIASLCLLILTRCSGTKLALPSVSLLPQLLLLGATGVFAYNMFFFRGLQHITASRASLFIASTPLVVTLLASIFAGERLTARKILGITISLTGAILVISKGEPQGLLQAGLGPGELALLGCVASWSCYSLLGRAVLQRLPPLVATTYACCFGTLLLLFPALQEGFIGRVMGITPSSWSSLAYLGVLGTAVGFIFYYRAIAQIGASRTAVFINLVPVFALIQATVLLGETVRPLVFAGGLLVIAGVAMTNR